MIASSSSPSSARPRARGRRRAARPPSHRRHRRLRRRPPTDFRTAVAVALAHLAVADFAAPAALIVAARLHHVLEALEVAAHAALGQAERVAGLLDQALVLARRSRTATRVEPSSTGSNVTSPSFWSPSVERHAIRESGCCSTISASHSASRPATSAAQWRFLSSSWRTSFTPSMNRGNSSKRVHWPYATRTGTFTTIDSRIADIGHLLRLSLWSLTYPRGRPGTRPGGDRGRRSGLRHAWHGRPVLVPGRAVSRVLRAVLTMAGRTARRSPAR